MKVLITGATGFLGSNLADILSRNKKNKIYLTDIQKPRSEKKHKFFECDLATSDTVRSLLKKTSPTCIYHLAGKFSDDYDSNYRSNVVSAKNIFDSIDALSLKTRILVVGSAAEYGSVATNPVKETDPLNPITTYGLTKMFQTQLSQFYQKTRGLDVVIARIFNLIGPGISENLFAGKVLSQIDSYLNGKTKEIVTGDLSTFRDYLSAEDAVLKLIAIMNGGKSGEVYNVGSGRPVKMRTLLKSLLSEKNIPLSAIKEKSPLISKKGKSVKKIYADISKIRKI